MSILKEVLETVEGTELTNMIGKQTKINALADNIAYLIEHTVNGNRFKDIDLAYVYNVGLVPLVEGNTVYVDRTLPITIYLESYRGVEMSLGIRLTTLVEHATTDKGCSVQGTVPTVSQVWIDTLPEKEEDVDTVTQYMETNFGRHTDAHEDRAMRGYEDSVNHDSYETEDKLVEYINKQIAGDPVTEKTYSDMLEAYMNENNIKCNIEPYKQ